MQTAVQTALSHLVLNVPRPVAGGPEVRFQLAAALPALHVGLAPPDQPAATDYSLTPLLRALSPERLVRLLAYVMLEYQVVVVSSDPELRLSACEMVQSLLSPLQWMQVYVPSVPDAWLELLSTPFPCLIGLSPAQARHLPTILPSRMALLQLDEGHLAEPRERPPPLPSREAGPLQAVV